MTTLSHLQQLLPNSTSRTERIGYGLIFLWLFVMISLPISYWVWGDTALPVGITVAALVQASAVFFIVQSYWGIRQSSIAFTVVAIITWGAEFIGHQTGLPFGDYHYTQILQPQIMGVPLLIPIAWFMLLPPCWALAQVIVGERNSWLKRCQFIGISALALTAWDLFLDPQMVGWEFWLWDQPGSYFGIPLLNYAGWFLVAGLVTALVNPRPLPIMPLGLVYACVWFLQSVGQAVFWGQPGPAMCGFLGMGSIILITYWRYRQRST